MNYTHKFSKKVFVGLITLMMLTALIPLQTLKAAHNPHSTEYDYGVEFWHDDTPDTGFYINAAANFTLQQVKEPNFGTSAGEWSVMNLLRGMYTGSDYINQIPNNYFEGYKDKVFNYVESKDGNLDRNKSTEWSRTILTMNAMNQDITNIAGYDFIEKLSESHRFSYRQGINGPIWILLSMNTGRDKLYESEAADANTEGKLLDYILDREIYNPTQDITGGWSLFVYGNNPQPDPDITGMALQGLAPYYLDKAMFEATDSRHTYEEFAQAVERGVVALKRTQLSDGSFAAFGNTNSESTTQAIVGLTELNIDPLTEGHKLPHINQIVNFKTVGTFQNGVFTNNMIDSLLTFWADRSFATKSKANGESYAIGGFKHIKSGNDGGGGAGTAVNGMATDQSLYGLIAYDRFKQNENKLYDMQDMLPRRGGKSYDSYESTEYKINLYLNENKEVLDKKVPKTVSPYEIIELPEWEDEGKKIVGWTNRTDGKGKLFEPGALLSIPNLQGQGNELNLHAVYDMDEFKLTLNSDGGTYDEAKVPSTITVDDQVKLPTKDEISKKGYAFTGWYENAEFIGDRHTEIKKGTTSNVEFFAKWNQLTIDTQALEKAINKVEKISTKGMTKESVLLFTSIIEEAKELLASQDTTQEAIDQMTDKVNNAEKILVVDKSELEEKIKEGKKVLE